MSTIYDVDLSTFLGRLGSLYGKYRLCPPFLLREAAGSWIARGIPLSHCVEVTERYLSRHAGSCYSGSGDWNFAWLSNLIQTTWHDRTFARPPRPTPKPTRDHDWLDEHSADEPNQRPGRREIFTARPPNFVSKPGSFEPGRIGLRQKAPRATDTRSAVPQQGPRPPRSAPKSSGQELAPSPRRST